MKEMKLMLLVLLVAVTGCKSSDNSLTLLRAKEAIVVRYMVLQDVIVSSELMKLGKKGK